MARPLTAVSLPLAIVSALLIAALPDASAQSTTVPPPVVASFSTTVASGLNQPQGVAIDSSGNLFVANAGAGSVVEFPANDGPSITLMTGLSYNKGITVDSNGNIYSTSYGGNIEKAPAGGGANSGAVFTSGSSCPDFAAMGYYIGFQDVTADGDGNIYAAGQGKSYLMEFDQAANCTEVLTPTQLGSNAVSNVASDLAGDLYYSVGSSIYYLPAGSQTPTLVPATVSTVNALKVDAKGNLFITDNGEIDEVPFVSGALDPSGLTYLMPSGAPYTVAVDPSGAIYSADFNGNTVLRTVIGSLALGSSAVGTQGTPGVLTYTFNAAITPASFNYVSGSGSSTQFATVIPTTPPATTCAIGTAYPASTSGTPSYCTLNIAIDPSAPGKVTGAVLFTAGSSTLATTYLSGSGLGGALSVNPGTQTSLGTFTMPSAVAIDGSGNLFVADNSLNTVTEISSGNGTPVTVGSGLNAPQGVTVDPAGNLFIADTGNNRVVEVPLVAGVLNTAAQTVVASSLSAPMGLALDIYGNILVANSGAGNVLEIPNQGGVAGVLAPFTIGSGFQKPVAIAVDANNDIFVADSTAANIVDLTSPTQQSNILTDISQISGLAVDANDDIFFTQTGSPSVTKVPFIAGAYATNSTVSLGLGLIGPQGIALDTAGNLYVADALGGAAYEIQRTLGALSFGKVNIGETSASQSLSLSNFGNQPLTFSTPFFAASGGDTADFSVAASDTNGCDESLATGASCGVSAAFSPIATGTLSETVDFQSDATNASPIAATLSGLGANSAPTTLTLSVSPTGQIDFGQTITVTATVVPQSSSTLTPTGTVQFTVDGANYGNPVTLGTDGTATDAITGLSGGAHEINATYSGDDTFASSAATTPLNLTIATAPTVTTVTGTINGSTAVATGTSATFTTTVAPGFAPPPYPSGSVSFYANGSTTALGTAPLTNGVATFTTTALPNGQYSVTAVYSGDSDFAASTSGSYAVYVSPPTFVMSNLPSSLSVSAHGSASLSFTLTPIAGYTGTVFFACSGLPQDTTCNFSPGAADFTVTPGTQTVQLTVNSGVAILPGFIALPAVLLLAALLFFQRRREMPRLLMMIVLLGGGAILSSSLSGCSSAASNGTPSGSSNVTVELTGSPAPSGQNIVQHFTFNLQVQ
ncbi:MAG TPA: Ig-like domain repeat protein [Acidobacteriaceae bacterium]|nr:Ig-like domain repeat protein [Acidobacteriaceae bacterium]